MYSMKSKAFPRAFLCTVNLVSWSAFRHRLDIVGTRLSRAPQSRPDLVDEASGGYVDE